jgi:hypothetical protein
MLPTPTPETISVTIAGHVFTFRRLTWRDDLRFQALRSKDPKLSLLAYAMVSVDERPVGSLATGQKLVMKYPKPVRERLVILYKGSLPDNRLLDAALPELAPEPKVAQAVIDQDEESTEQKAEDYLNRRFGADEARGQRTGRSDRPGRRYGRGNPGAAGSPYR